MLCLCSELLLFLKYFSAIFEEKKTLEMTSNHERDIALLSNDKERAVYYCICHKKKCTLLARTATPLDAS